MSSKNDESVGILGGALIIFFVLWYFTNWWIALLLSFLAVGFYISEEEKKNKKDAETTSSKSYSSSSNRSYSNSNSSNTSSNISHSQKDRIMQEIDYRKYLIKELIKIYEENSRNNSRIQRDIWEDMNRMETGSDAYNEMRNHAYRFDDYQEKYTNEMLSEKDRLESEIRYLELKLKKL